MRLLAIEQDRQVQALLRHHASCRWPAVEIACHEPLVHGPVPPEFLAQGYDAVLLAHRWPGGDGLEWLHDLAGRQGFAPVIFLADDEGSAVRESALASGAEAVVGRRRIAHGQLLEAIERASRRQRHAVAEWRLSSQARDSHRFGDAVIPGYRRARVLARGSVSQLYVAESEKAGALVVLKVTPSRRDESGIDQSFERFLQEYEIAERVRHPNVVRLHELGIADDHAYLAMEYYPRGDLRRLMNGGPLAPADALQYALQISQVLAAVHEAGILHRDLKPGNVMLREDGSPALIDFGMAKQAAFDLELTDKGLIFGTPHYMSPEQGHGERLDGRSDLYSLGVMLFEMLTAEKPYRADNPMTVLYMHRNAPIPQLEPRLVLLQPLLNRLMAKHPNDRFGDALEAAASITSARQAWLAQALDQ